MEEIKVGILTVSDSCSAGKSEDISGKNLAEFVVSRFGKAGWKIDRRSCVPDDMDKIQEVLLKWSDEDKLQLVLTTGGTGFSPRDVTPEATKKVIHKEAPGLVTVMLSKSLNVTPMAMISRPVAGIRNKTLIINLPGSSKGAKECFQFVCETLPHALDVLNEAGERVTKAHVKELAANGCHLLEAYAFQAHGGHTCGGHDHPVHHHHAGHSSSVDASQVARRHRESPFPMISVVEAQKKVLEFCDVIGTEKVDFRKALGRVLAEDVFAQDPLPPFPASIKDGYAVVAADGAGLRPVVGDSNAGSRPDAKIKPGECVRINTGAPVPAGADAVVQVEDTKLVRASDDGKTELEIEILSTPKPGQDIRPVGSDIALGSKVLPAGIRVGPAEVGLLAAVGAIVVEVYKRPTVALLSTGDEIQDPSADPSLKSGSGLIRDSNKATLMSLISGENGFPVVDCGIARDEVNTLLNKLKEALTAADIIVTTGGVSMGDRDLIRQVLVQDLGATIHFARVNMKPGKPTTFATLLWKDKRKLFLGLPGNPVSATVTAHLYVLPACRKISGFRQPLAAKIRAKLPFPVRLDPRPEYMRVVLSWSPGESIASVASTGNQISSRLESFRAANGLIILPGATSAQKEIEAGAELDAMVIGPLLEDF